jgi:hypothetical protein
VPRRGRARPSPRPVTLLLPSLAKKDRQRIGLPSRLPGRSPRSLYPSRGGQRNGARDPKANQVGTGAKSSSCAAEPNQELALVGGHELPGESGHDVARWLPMDALRRAHSQESLARAWRKATAAPEGKILDMARPRVR